jgi:hypothetical protein
MVSIAKARVQAESACVGCLKQRLPRSSAALRSKGNVGKWTRHGRRHEGPVAAGRVAGIGVCGGVRAIRISASGISEGQGRLIQSRFEDAIRWLEKARNALPELPIHHAYLAAAYALHGDAERAAVELAEAQRRSANYSSIARLKPTLSRDTQFQGARPEIRAMFEATYFAGLRKAGMPEE